MLKSEKIPVLKRYFQEVLTRIMYKVFKKVGLSVIKIRNCIGSTKIIEIYQYVTRINFRLNGNNTKDKLHNIARRLRE